MKRASYVLGSVLIAFALTTGRANAQEFEDYVLPEPYSTGWALYVDNDFLSLLSRDQQYTGGFTLTLSGRRAREYWFSVDPILKTFDELVGFDRAYARGWRRQTHNFEVGLVAFTPEDVDTSEPIFDDRPYGSLAFISNAQQTAHVERNVAYESSFALGVLGTKIAEETQGFIHESLDQDVPLGWRNQISDGGELTFRYSAMRQTTRWMKHDPNGLGYEFKTNVGGSIGYTTEASVGIAWRWGRINSPWWSFNPHHAEYINLGTPVVETDDRPPRKELFLWGGVQLRYRFYNALYEGQFRDSEVTYDRDDDLRSVLGELSVGVTSEQASGLRLSFSIRARTDELKDSTGDTPIWGSVIISKSY